MKNWHVVVVGVSAVITIAVQQLDILKLNDTISIHDHANKERIENLKINLDYEQSRGDRWKETSFKSARAAAECVSIINPEAGARLNRNLDAMMSSGSNDGDIQ